MSIYVRNPFASLKLLSCLLMFTKVGYCDVFVMLCAGDVVCSFWRDLKPYFGGVDFWRACFVSFLAGDSHTYVGIHT